MAIETYELRVAFKANFQPMECVFHDRIDNTGDEKSWIVAEQLLDALQAGVSPNIWFERLLTCMSADCWISYLSAIRVGPNGGNSTDTRPDAETLVGTVSEPMHAEQLSGCVIWISETEPENQGRNFLPGVPETFLEASRWTTDAKAAYQSFITFHLAGFSLAAGLALPAIFDRVAKTSRVIANGYLSPKPGTQRRREKPL